MSELPQAFYHADGEHFLPSALTIGPWDSRLQHGGPASALLARAMRRYRDGARFLLSRLTVEMLRPLVLGRMRVEVEPLRLGKRVEWLRALLYIDETEVASASCVRIAQDTLELETPNAEPEPPPRSPDGVEPLAFDFFPSVVGYHRGVELRVVDGEWGRGPIVAWMRTLEPLVAGEEPSGLERLVLLADASNGLAPALDLRRFTFLNPDLTVYVNREPAGEWFGFAARSVPRETGVGLVQSTLFDSAGELGRSLQSLILQRRT